MNFTLASQFLNIWDFLGAIFCILCVFVNEASVNSVASLKSEQKYSRKIQQEPKN